MPFYQKGDVRIRYEEAGSGFPLLLVPGGGLNSRVSNWPNAVFNSMEIFRDEFRCITMDQRNANGGESNGPIPASDPWGAFADDQLGLMDHLGIRQFLFMGYCIGGCFALKLMQQAPDRVVAGVLVQTVGHHPDHPDYMYNSGRDVWAPELLSRRPDLKPEQIEPYLHALYRVRPEFVYSVSPDFARSCQTPILVLPDETPAHPLVSSVEGRVIVPECRDHGVSMARAAGTESPDHRPGPVVPPGASARRLAVFAGGAISGAAALDCPGMVENSGIDR
jgi:pimeloyl-ACP methyl ester carboxylesterase